MEAARHLRAVDAQTGEIADDVDVQALQAELAEVKSELELLQQDFLKKLAEIRRLKADKERERLIYTRRAEVEEVFDYWRATCNHKRSKLTPLRFDAVKGILEHGYSPEQIRLAIDGAAFDPFCKPRKNGTVERFDDLELICRDGKYLETFACKAPRR
jgi:hypothetical protein